MIEYDVTFRFRTEDAEPRREMTAEQVAAKVVPFVFPGKGTVYVMGSAMVRVDNPERKKSK